MSNPYSAPSRAPAGTRASRVPAPTENSIVRGAFARFIAASRVSADHRDADEVAAALWPTDRTTGAVLRAVATPGASGDHPGLVASATADFLADLAPLSAGAQLVAAGLQVRLDGRGTLSIPSRNFALSGLPWVAENEPIPVRQLSFAERTLGPQGTMAVIVALSRSLAKRSAALPIFSQMLREEAAVSLDAALFSAAAATADHPAGLLHGVTATSVDVGGTLDRLAAAASAAGGSGSVVFIAAPEQAAMIRLRQPDFAFPVLASLALPAGRVIALDPGAFASAIEVSAVETVSQAALHMDDAPLEIVGEGGPTADPVRSLWQTDTVAIRVWLDIAFLMRADGLVAYADGVTWPDYI